MMRKLLDFLRPRRYDEGTDDTVRGLNAATENEGARIQEIRRQRRDRDFLAARLLPQPESRDGGGGRRGEDR